MTTTQEYGSLREKIAAESKARRERYAGFEALYAQAHEAGMAAGNACTPRAMIVGSPSTPFGSDVDLKQKHWVVEDGVCGFAWVTVFPGNCSFARWLTKFKGGGRQYRGGVCAKWVGEFNQSMQRKEAYAHAFAKVLQDAGIKACSGSRMD